MTADVFAALVVSDFLRLRAYDPLQAHFRTYLYAIARQTICDRYRRLVRHREVSLEGLDEVSPQLARDPGPPVELLLGELLPGLTGQLRRLCELSLRPDGDEELHRAFSPANFRKTCQRVRETAHDRLADA